MLQGTAEITTLLFKHFPSSGKISFFLLLKNEPVLLFQFSSFLNTSCLTFFGAHLWCHPSFFLQLIYILLSPALFLYFLSAPKLFFLLTSCPLQNSFLYFLSSPKLFFIPPVFSRSLLILFLTRFVLRCFVLRRFVLRCFVLVSAATVCYLKWIRWLWQLFFLTWNVSTGFDSSCFLPEMNQLALTSAVSYLEQNSWRSPVLERWFLHTGKWLFLKIKREKILLNPREFHFARIPLLCYSTCYGLTKYVNWDLLNFLLPLSAIQ